MLKFATRIGLCGFLTALAISAAGSTELLDVDLNGLEIRLSEKNGGIVSISHPLLGEVLNATSETAGLVNLAYPIPSFVPMRLGTEHSKARIVRQDNEVAIIYDHLSPSRTHVPLPEGRVSARVTIKAAPDGKSVIFSCQIENRSSVQIPQILFPDLHGIKPFAGIDKTHIRFATGAVAPFSGPARFPDAAFYADLGWSSYPAGGSPQLNAIRWLDLGSIKSGLSVFQKRWGYSVRPGVRTRRTETDPSSLRLAWEHKYSIEAGQSWDTGEFWFTPHRGGWAKGIETFREYARQMSPPRDVPRHIQDDVAFQTLWMIQTPETDPAMAAFKFKDLPRVARDASKHGIHELVLWNWSNCFTLPVEARPELGTPEELVNAIAECRKLGVNVAPFVSVVTLAKESAERYGIPAAQGAFRDFSWTYHPELIPNLNAFYMGGDYPVKFWEIAEVSDPRNELWLKEVEQTLSNWVARGLYSLAWDQFNSMNVGDEKAPLVSLVERLRKQARAHDPQSTFGGESYGDIRGNFEYDTEVLDYTWNWTSSAGDMAPILNVFGRPRLNCNVEASPEMVKQAFCENLYVNAMPRKLDSPNGSALVSDSPTLTAALKEITPLRRLFLPYFTEGHALGNSMLDEVPTGALVRGYQLDRKLLIVVLNTQGPQEIKLHCDLSLWFPPSKEYAIHYYDQIGRIAQTSALSNAQWTGLTSTLQPYELAFFEIEAK